MFWILIVGVNGGSLTPTNSLPLLAFDIWGMAQQALAFVLLSGLVLMVFPGRVLHIVTFVRWHMVLWSSLLMLPPIGELVIGGICLLV